MNAALIPAPGLRGQSLEIGPAPALHGEQPGSHFQLGQPNGAGCRTAAILHGVALRIALGKSSQARCPVSAAFSGPVETFLARQRERGRLVPRFVERELRSFLDCRILARGFLMVHCDAWTGWCLIANVGGSVRCAAGGAAASAEVQSHEVLRCACAHQSTVGRNPEDPCLPWPPHEGSAHCPGHSG